MAKPAPGSVLNLLIINKAGGLIYQKTFNGKSLLERCRVGLSAAILSEGLAQLSQNEYLVLAGTFHGVHAIASRLSPTDRSSGLEVFEAESFKMNCLQTLTGVKFVLITLPAYALSDNVLKNVYEIYAEQLRDPFYAAEMPIRSETFDKKIAACIRSFS